jgi:hypothetical protein
MMRVAYLKGTTKEELALSIGLMILESGSFEVAGEKCALHVIGENSKEFLANALVPDSTAKLAFEIDTPKNPMQVFFGYEIIEAK